MTTIVCPKEKSQPRYPIEICEKKCKKKCDKYRALVDKQQGLFKEEK